MAKQWLLLASVITGVSFGLSFITTRNLKQAVSTGIITLASASVGVAIIEDKKAFVPQTIKQINPVKEDDRRSDQQLLSTDLAVAGSSSPASDPPLTDRVAVFWDYENVKVPAQTSAPLAESLLDYARTLGHPQQKIVYSNWQRQDDVSAQVLYSLGFEPIYVSMGKRNSVDVKLAIDCLESAYEHPSIRQFIIVTGDKDFIPLVNALKKLQRQVTIIGQTDRVSEQLLLSADEFVSLKQLLEGTADRSHPKAKASTQAQDNQITPTLSYEEAVNCLIEAIDAACEQGKSTQLSTLGRLMRDIDARFQGASGVYQQDGTPFESFSDLVAAAEHDGKIRVQTTEKGFKELFLIEEDPHEESEFRAQSRLNLEREQWKILIGEVEIAFQDLKPVLKFVPLLRFVTKSKASGSLSFLSHGSLRKALQHLIEVGILVKQADGGFRLIDHLHETMETLLDQLIAD